MEPMNKDNAAASLVDKFINPVLVYRVAYTRNYDFLVPRHLSAI